MDSASLSGLIASLVGALGMTLAWAALRRAREQRETPPAYSPREEEPVGDADSAMAPPEAPPWPSRPGPSPDPPAPPAYDAEPKAPSPSPPPGSPSPAGPPAAPPTYDPVQQSPPAPYGSPWGSPWEPSGYGAVPEGPPQGSYAPPQWQQPTSGPARRTGARFGGTALVMAITLSVIVLAGAALLIGMTLSGDRTPPGHTRGPSVGATEPAGPTATVTVTVFATPLAAPPAAAADGGGVDGTAWIAAVGAIIAGFGTLASGAAAMAALRRSGGKEHRPVHHRSDGRSRRSQW